MFNAQNDEIINRFEKVKITQRINKLTTL